MFSNALQLTVMNKVQRGSKKKKQKETPCVPQMRHEIFPRKRLLKDETFAR